MDIKIAKSLQKAVGVKDDGVIGAGSLTALYRKLGASAANADLLGKASNVFLRKYGILDNHLLLAHFLAQAAKETGGFQFFIEIASGKAYEGRKDLGNIVAGYGVKYKGHGIFQLTGYDNYVQYSKYIGLDLVKYPERAAEPDLSVYIACEFWERKDLASLALKDDVVGVTKKVNGGDNGLEERKMYLRRIKEWMGIR